MRLPIILTIPIALAACGKDKDQSTDTTGDPCSGFSVAKTGNGDVATAVTVSWTTSTAGTPSMTLALGNEVSDWASTTEGTDHAVSAWGLVAGETYTWTGRVHTASGEEITCASQDLKVAPPPSDVMKFDVNVSEPGAAMADGYLLISTIGVDSAWVAIVDGQGRFRFTHAMDEDGMTTAHARVGRDGTSVLWNQFDQDRVDDIGSVARVSLDGTVSTRTRTALAHHDFAELPDGRIAWNGYDRRDFAISDVDGPDDYATNCPGGLCPIAGEAIWEGDEGITGDNDGVEILNWWDDSTRDPWWVCDHMRDYSSFVPDYYEWFHMNSLAYEETEDAYYAMTRYQDTLFKVDRATGVILWRMGGIDSDFTLSSGDWFDHGHMSDVWPGGFVLFDNGDHRGYSRAAEYSWNEATGTAQLVWSVDHPSMQMLPILGDVRRLPNGNRLIVWGADAIIQEVTTAGDVVWEMQSASGGFGVVGRAEYLSTLTP